MATYVNKRDLSAFKQELGVTELCIFTYTRGNNSKYPGTTGVYLGKVDKDGDCIEPVAYCSKTMADDFVANDAFTIPCVVGDTTDGAHVLVKQGGGKADGFC